MFADLSPQPHTTQNVRTWQPVLRSSSLTLQSRCPARGATALRSPSLPSSPKSAHPNLQEWVQPTQIESLHRQNCTDAGTTLDHALSDLLNKIHSCGVAGEFIWSIVAASVWQSCRETRNLKIRKLGMKIHPTELLQNWWSVCMVALEGLSLIWEIEDG